jgi:hypothetical protein
MTQFDGCYSMLFRLGSQKTSLSQGIIHELLYCRKCLKTKCSSKHSGPKNDEMCEQFGQGLAHSEKLRAVMVESPGGLAKIRHRSHGRRKRGGRIDLRKGREIV